MVADSSPTEDETHTPSAPAQLVAGRYEVVRVLGQGSSGRTLLCDDLIAGVRVAIKELRFDQLDAWKQLELFEREAKALSLLEHPAIPKVFAFFRDESRSPAAYIVQEFLDGSSLKQRIDSGPMLGQQEVHGVALSMLEVLDYLHGRAPPVLHRDIKPSNILLRPDGGVALIDFGGVLLGWGSSHAEGTTVVGTFGYMPPEQLVGQAGPASDLYALGATLLHALTGRPPTDFPFDAGRIDVPADLPASALKKLIEALLRPAPRDRLQSARVAMEMLTSQAPPPRHATRQGTAVAPIGRPAHEVMVVSENGPHFVEMGPPPRDPTGPYKDVYRNLLNPLFPSKRLWGRSMHVFWVAMAALGSFSTLGLLPLLYAQTLRTRKRKYRHLFLDGHATVGVIRHTRAGGVYATFKYEFEVGGSAYVAFMDYATEMAQFWSEGDRVPVLFDPDDPRRSCFVYR